MRYNTKQSDDALFRGSGRDMGDCAWRYDFQEAIERGVEYD